MQIPGLRGVGPGEVLKRSVTDFMEDDMMTYAAALAYYILFALFPFIVFLIALLGFLNVPQFFDWLKAQAGTVLPQQAMDQVNQVIAQIQQPRGGLLSFGIIVALWSASAGIRSVMNALNVAYDVEEGRPAWKLYPLSILYTIGLALMVILGVGLMVLGPQGMSWLANQIGLGQFIVTLWNWVRWPLAVLLLMLAVAIVYYVAPDVEQEFRFITPGAILSVIVWIAASLGFAYYVGNFADYSATYGSIGAIIILLFYFFISAAVLLLGAEINATIEHHAPGGKEPGEKVPEAKKAETADGQKQPA
jgi:membrane protein